MRAVKANKEYRVTEANKQMYLNDGYDIIDDEGNIIEYSPKKTIKYSEYQKLKKELEEVKANNSNEDLTKLMQSRIDELTKFNENLTSEKEKLTEANTELAKQIEKLTKQIEKGKNE